MAKLYGTGTAIVTPFKKSGVVDETALRKLVDWQIKNKVEFLVPCGSTGEAITMTRGERRSVIEIVVEQTNGRVPVIPGTGSSSTMDSIHLSKDAKQAGADAVLVVGPAYNKPTQEGYYLHFKSIIEECSVKIVLYNIPGRTGGNIMPETVLKLAEEYKKNVIGIKEASNNFEQIMQIIKHKPDSFAVLSGEDSLTLALIACGADGVIAVLPNEMPKDFSDMVRFALKGDFKKARELHYKMFPLMKANFLESNPIPVKTAMVMMGKVEENFRLPLTKMTNQNKLKLKKVLKDLKLV
jgi:4-hydroxy-tetrahydrodipicolinate synthase